MQVFGRAIRFGLYLPPHAFSFPEYLRVWQAAEELGYDAAYVTDHLVTRPDESADGFAEIFESFTLLSAMASRTRHIRCGINVVGNTFRNPGLVAKMAVTLDHISDGRLELGLGSAHHQIEHEQYDIPFYTTGHRLRMLKEAAIMIRNLLANEVTTFEGRYYKLNQAVAKPMPVQSHIPMIIGGIGEDLTLRIVAESADIWNAYVRLSPDAYQHKLDVLSRHCEALGRDVTEIRKSLIIFAITARTELQAKRKAEQHATSDPLVGTPEKIAETLISYVRLGVNDFLFYFPSPVDLDSLELVSSAIAPLVKAESGVT